ncbi:MAG: extracellular solute-binding protein [Terracidiphilus sp.]
MTARLGLSRNLSRSVALNILVSLLLCSSVTCSRQTLPKPVTLTYLDVEWEAPDELSGIWHDLRDFTQQTGIHVNRLPAPDGSLNQLAMWKELLQKGGTAPDVYSIDVAWSGILSQYLMNLKPYFADDLASVPPEVISSYMVADKLVALPHHAYIGLLFYRPDLLRRYGYHDPPKTWDELEAMARRIQAGERARGVKDFWGYVWQGAATEDLTCNGLEWQMGTGGGRIIEDNQTISVNNPQSIKAWQRAARWVGTISPPDVTAQAKWDAGNVWAAGKAAFIRAWASDYSMILLHKPPSGVSRYGVTSVPGGRDGRADVLGGNGLAVSRYSAHPNEALQLIRFLQERDVRILRGTEHIEPPRELELYELPEVLRQYPQLPNLRHNGGTVVARPSIVAGQRYEEVTRAYIGALHSVLTGEKTAPTAAAELEKELMKITGFKRGPPSTMGRTE